MDRVKCISGFWIKILAIACMLTDHIGAILFPQYRELRMIGRIAFPLFVFLLVEGFFYTRNRNRYLIRLVAFAFFSEIPFDLALKHDIFYWDSQNVFWTLAIGLVVLMAVEQYGQFYPPMEFAIVMLGYLAAGICETDYHGGGVVLIYLFYRCRQKQWLKLICLFAIALICYKPIELYSLLAFIPILLYNGKEGPKALFAKTDSALYRVKKNCVKYAFYAFYPAHLMILALIRGIG